MLWCTRLCLTDLNRVRKPFLLKFLPFPCRTTLKKTGLTRPLAKTRSSPCRPALGLVLTRTCSVPTCVMLLLRFGTCVLMILQQALGARRKATFVLCTVLIAVQTLLAK